MRGLLVTAVSLSAALAARARYRNWGATPVERAQPLDGDELVPEPAVVTTLAVTVEAPPERVWPWLVQMGQNRAGMYSYERLENLVGLHIHNADAIHSEWQHLAPGDRVWLVPPRWMGMPEGYSLPVAKIVPGHSLVLRQAPPEAPWDSVWSFHVVPLADDRCRLISRSRARRGSPVVDGLTYVFDPVVVLMTRKMLLGIKHRAEHAWWYADAITPVESSSQRLHS